MLVRRSHQEEPESLRGKLVELLTDFRSLLQTDDLRRKVKELVPAFHLLRDLGSSLIPSEGKSAARDRIIQYLRKYPQTIISGEELMVVAGIGEWARRARELRVEFGWPIFTGITVKEMATEDSDSIFGDFDLSSMKPDDYFLASDKQDREAAFRWNLANEIRNKDLSVRDKILEFLRQNVGKEITGEELRYVSGNKTEWARRVRELRTEYGWPIVTKQAGNFELPVGVYVLMQDRQSPAHDRIIPDKVRREVLRRDGYKCRQCSWSHSLWNPSDPRHLEIHHIEEHSKGGSNTENNLITVCTVCHDEIHKI